MAASYDDLRHLEVFTADFADVRQIDISLEDGSYTLSREEGEDSLWLFQEEETEITDLRNALEMLTAEEFTNTEPYQKEEIGLTVHLDNENFPTVQIELYRYDGTHCLAVVDDESVSLVERSTVVDLIETVQTIVLG